jgi:hypothetical protein
VACDGKALQTASVADAKVMAHAFFIVANARRRSRQEIS